MEAAGLTARHGNNDRMPYTPLPERIDDAGLLLVGGTFDPPHGAHVELPRRASAQLLIDTSGGIAPSLVFVPAAVSPFKRSSHAAASGEDRVAMLRAAIKGVDRASVWTEEIDRAERARRQIDASGGGGGRREPEPSYWIDTLCALRALIDRPGHKRVRVWFILGSDQAVQFHRWRSYREILAQAEPVVLLREPVGTTAAFQEALTAAGVWSVNEIDWWLERVAQVGLEEVSSTHIRGLLARCADARLRGEVDHAARQELSRLLAPGVLEVIRERGLYGHALS